MKRLYLILSMILLLAGCTFDELRESLPKVESKTFSIEQAKAFFEKDFPGEYIWFLGRILTWNGAGKL